MKHFLAKATFVLFLLSIVATTLDVGAFGRNENFDAKAMANDIIERVQEREDACKRTDKKRYLADDARELARDKPSKATEALYREKLADFNASNQWLKDTYGGDYDYMCILNVQTPRSIVIHHTAIDYNTNPDQHDTVGRIHQRQGYSKGCFGVHNAYHFTVGASGHVKQSRCLFERSQHTSNQEIKFDSIGIVLGGNFEHNELTRPMVKSMNDLIDMLQDEFNIQDIQGHCHSKGTACPGKNMRKYLIRHYDIPACEGYESDLHEDHEEHAHVEQPRETDPLPDVTNPEMIKATRWYTDEMRVEKLASFDMKFSRYYTPVPGQSRYYRDTYEQDFYVNCQGNCFKTADGHTLSHDQAGYVLACPPNFKHGTKVYIEDWGTATCHDRGGAIKGRRLDLWSGVGDAGLNNVKNPAFPHGNRRVTIVSVP